MSDLPFQFKFKEAGIDMSEMKKLDGRQELMTITAEECGELIQACSKSMRRGILFNDQQLKDEIGDVYTMINLLVDYDVVSWTEIEERMKNAELVKKLEKIDGYVPAGTDNKNDA